MASYDDDNDLTKWLQSQDAPNLTPQSSWQAPQQDAQGGPGVWSKARDMMDRQAAMQYQPQDYSKYLGKSEAAPDRSGHDFRTILAMALDLFGNKGRGAGQLMAAGNQTFDQKEAAWKRDNGPQAMLARQMQVKQLEGADRAAFNQDRSQLGAQIGQEVQLAGAQQAQGNADRTFGASRDDHDDALAQQQLQRQVQEEQFGASQGLTREQMAQAKALQEAQMRQSAGQFGAGQAQAARFHQDQLNYQQQQQEIERQRIAAQQAQAAAAAAQHATERGQDLSHQLSEETKDERRLLPSLAVVRANMDKYPENTLPGIGPLNSVEPNGFWGKAAQFINTPEADKTGSRKDFAADNLAMQKAMKDINEFDIRALSGANAPQAEVIREQLRMGGNNPQTVRQAIIAFDDLLTKDFQSRASGGRQEAMRGLLAPYGREGVIGMPGETDPLLGIQGLTPKKRTPLE
jgi:hypothetical protein